MNFFSNLKKIRKLRNVTQDALSTHLGVKPNTISNYENGISEPDYLILEKIVNFLDISADILLFGDVDEVSHNKNDKIDQKVSQKISQTVSQSTGKSTGNGTGNDKNASQLEIENAYLRGKVDALKEMLADKKEKIRKVKKTA
ncbi:MAG TPA: helix-turn-helix transcriptional regulator [Chitinophagales bacterium]|nr:helix-turn-helix transcriptional regulator [Chitinophagales bacterium]